MKRFLLISACAAALSAFPAIAQDAGPPIIYRAGYNPAEEKRDGIGLLPDEAWGEMRNGLQAALSIPATLRLNERVPIYLVVRNVSDKTIRFSGKEPHRNLRLSYSKRFIWSVPHVADQLFDYRHHQLEPGQQTHLLVDHLQIMAEGEKVPRNAVKYHKTGPVNLSLTFNTSAPEIRLPDGTLGKARRGPNEWTGYLRTAKIRKLELLAEKVPFSVKAPPELPDNHGLGHLDEIPGGWGTAEWHLVPLREKLMLHIHTKTHAMYLDDFGSYQGHLFWGPIPVERSVELGLLDRVKTLLTKELLAKKTPSGSPSSIKFLLDGPQQLVEIGLALVPLLPTDADEIIPRSLLYDRTIRDRRSELYAMGLKEEVQTALAQLRKADPPLPDPKSFTVISALKTIPEGLTEQSWGPEIDGLRAAAVMPERIHVQDVVRARLFIRNVAEDDLFIAVSNESGYDHATLRSVTGEALPAQRPFFAPNGFDQRGVERNPGEFRDNPPRATLSKLLLKPGAIWELQTDASLGYNLDNFPPVIDGEPRRAITNVKAAPAEAFLTWHIHSLNGEEFKHSGPGEPFKSTRTWPTQGSWMGLLETAAMKITLEKPNARFAPDKKDAE